METKERRKFLRIEAEMEVDFWAKGPSMTSGRARVLNFCREGLGVLFSGMVGRGEHVDLTMRVPGDNVPILATAQVAWTDDRKSDPTGLSAGLRFVSIKPLDLARLLDCVYSRWLGNLREKL